MISICRWALCLGLIVWAVGCRSPVPPPARPAAEAPAIPRQLVQHQVIVTLAPATPDEWTRITAFLVQKYRLTQVGVFPLKSLGVQCVVLQVPADRAVAEVMALLTSEPLVESVQPNQFFQSSSDVANDPYGTLQYGLQVVRATHVHGVATGKGVTVALIDTGVDVEHPDLQGRITSTANFVEGGENTFAADRHGTAVAGVIAARSNNAIGIAGIAPEADIVALKACWQRTPTAPQALCSSWTLAKAVDHAVLAGVQVLNFSLAGPPDALLARLIARASEQGICVVAAALATAQGPGFPASLETVMGVLASDKQGNVHLSPGSYQAPVLAAPGIDILTTVPRHAYDFISGSSLAAAHVSGIAALLLEHAPGLAPEQLNRLLHATARPLAVAGQASPQPIGLVDACAALEQLMRRPLCAS
jgi:subtilisin family serine protease